MRIKHEVTLAENDLVQIADTPFRLAKAECAHHSTVAAEWIAGTQLDAGYWVRNLRQTVLFSQTVLALLGEGHDAFIEISPHPVLLPGIEQCIAESGADAAIALATTRKNTPEQAAMLTSLGALYEAGHNLDWALLYPGSRPPVPLPAYPWQNQPVWFTGSASSELRERRNRTFDHPLLGNRVPLAADGRRAIGLEAIEDLESLALVVGLQGRFDEAERIAGAELSPEQAAANVAYLKSMLSQPNSWDNLRSPSAKPAPPRSRTATGAPAANSVGKGA